MEPDTCKARVASLSAEMDAIYLADKLYWMQGDRNDLSARASYQRRLERLEEIRSELARLRSETAQRKGRGEESGTHPQTLRGEV
jgi:hypothetical protein